MIRPARRDDLTAVVAVMNAVDVATLGEPDTTEADIASGWDESGFDVTADAFVVEEDGTVVGYSELYGRSDTLFDLDVYVHPDHGVEPVVPLLAVGLARAEERAGSGSVVATWLPVGDPRQKAYNDAGFAAVRQFVRMRHEAVEAPPDTVEPAGITVRAFDREADSASVHAVLVESFAHHVRPVTPSLDKFTEQHLDHPDFDPQFWVVAEDAGEVVGALTAFNHGDIGFIPHVGVRTEYRRRGVGSAMVRRALHVLFGAGQPRVDLGVDVDDDVGAARLYEALGFSVLQQLELLERRL